MVPGPQEDRSHLFIVLLMWLSLVSASVAWFCSSNNYVNCSGRKRSHLGQLRVCGMVSSHSFCCFFPYFSIGRPLSIFHPPPIFSCPSSRSPSILAVGFPFSCVLGVFPLLLSLLVCLHQSLPCGLPISPCFSPIFLFSCPVASHRLSSGRSSFFCQLVNTL